MPVTFTTYTIRGDDLKFVGAYPSETSRAGEAKVLPYTSMLEFVAERFHSAEEYIQKTKSRQRLRLTPGRRG